jgi:ATP-dependent Clp protease, protease subunit
MRCASSPACARAAADSLLIRQSAQSICSALLALELADPTKDIKLYLNVGGGQQYSIMAVIDMMNACKCDVSTVALGSVSGSAVLVLASGTKGKRFSMKNARIIVNQPLGGTQGSYIDVRLQAQEQNRNLKIAQLVLSQRSGQSMDSAAELLDRDTFLSAEQAVELGIIDGVI